MEPEYWLKRWEDGRTGFHQPDGSPLLKRHWSAVAETRETALVPLCGRSRDLSILAHDGHPVIGVEIARAAADDFFSESPSVTQSVVSGLTVLSDSRVSVIVADLFDVTRTILGDICSARNIPQVTTWYDRAALVALKPEQRKRYLEWLHRVMPSGARGLLITLSYPQEERDGPPFSLPVDRVVDETRPFFNCTELGGGDPGDRTKTRWGLSWLAEHAFGLTRR